MIRIKGVRFSVDRRGLFSGAATYLCDGLDEAVGGTLPNPFGSVTEVGRNGGDWDVDEEKWIVTANFEGLVNEPRADQEEYNLDAEFSEEPIESHPSIASIIKTYGGFKREDGTVEFPETLPTGKTGSGTGLSQGKRGSEKNPFFGVTSYPAMRMIATHSSIKRALGSSIYSRVGRVLNSLPAGFDEPGGRQWLIMPPLVRRRGDVWDVTERYKDVGDDPHVVLLAKLIQK